MELNNDIYLLIYMIFAENADIRSILKLSTVNKNLRRISNDKRIWDLFGSIIFKNNLIFDFTDIKFGRYVVTTDKIIKNWMKSFIFELLPFRNNYQIIPVNDILEDSCSLFIQKLSQLKDVYYHSGVFYSYNLDTKINLFWWHISEYNSYQDKLFFSWPLINFMEDIIYPDWSEHNDRVVDSLNNCLLRWFSDSLPSLFDERNLNIFYDNFEEKLYIKSKTFNSNSNYDSGFVKKIDKYINLDP
jgi:hypothetical protein